MKIYAAVIQTNAMINTVPDVKNYHDEHVQLGGAGITVVNLE